MSSTSHKRHLLKAVSWRVVGTLDTMLLAWLISGSPLTGFKIGVAEVLTKIGLYYLHERVWFRADLTKITWLTSSKSRHLAKTITWRVVGTIDTMLLAWLISGNPMIGLKVGLAEVLTKMILYYLHERLWYRINFGLDKREHLHE